MSTGRPRAILSYLTTLALLLLSLLVTRRAAAAPELRLSIAWQGDCDDRDALRAETAARGADLIEGQPAEDSLHLDVFVQRTAAQGLLAEVLLSTATTRERRQVQARECVALRRAVAWVLGVLAEERATAERASGPSTASFPAVPAPAPLPTSTSAAANPVQPRPSSARPAKPPQPERPKPCAVAGSRWQLGSELVAGFGFVDAVAIGPALRGLYRPCTSWLPGIVLGASQLVSLGYTLRARSIVVERTTGQAGAWLALGVPALRVGVTFEAGRISATGASNGQGRGGSSSAPWLGFVAPLRLSVPLVAQVVTAELGLDALYTPLSYSLRFASGEQLAQPTHFELRATLGLSGHF